MKALEITTPSRLHLGFYNFYGENIMYGGLGIGLETPSTRIIIKKNMGTKIINKTSIYIDDVVENVLSRLGVRNVEIVIEKTIPRHVGLGSTTQLTLALGYGLSRLYGLGYSVRELAVILGRGFVSGIGIGVFEKGGFIIDSGRRVHGDKLEPVKSIDELPFIITRYRVPRNWYFLLFIPRGRRGFDEYVEKKFLEKIPSIPEDIKYRLYRVFLLKLLHGIASRDPILFGKALTELQNIVGEYFSKHQGGIYCCRESSIIAEILLQCGAYGVGQSSWGPLIYGFIEGYRNAVRLYKKVLRIIKEYGVELTYSYVSRPRNKGYSIKCFY